MDRKQTADLAARALEGDTAAQARLYTHYQTRLAGYFAKHGLASADSADAAQETWLRVLAATKTPQDFEAWLFGIACHVLMDAVRVSSNRPCRWWPEAEDQPPDCVLEQRETRDLVREAICSLPVDLRAAVVIRYSGGKSCREIARSLGTSEGAVANRLHRARKILRARLQGRV